MVLINVLMVGLVVKSTPFANRKLVTIMTTLQIECENGDMFIVDEDELDENDWFYENSGNVVLATELELIASFDHGLRAADETSYLIGCECAAQALLKFSELLSPVFYSIPLRLSDVQIIDWNEAFRSGTGIDYDGDGWSNTYDDQAYDTGSYIYERQYEMESLASDFGFIVETNGDCGMTWIYQHSN